MIADLVSMQADIVKYPLKTVVERNRSAHTFKGRRIWKVEKKGRHSSQNLFYSLLSTLWFAINTAFLLEDIILLSIFWFVNGWQRANLAFLCLSKNQVSFVCNIFSFLLEKKNPHCKTLFCPLQGENIVCIFLYFLYRISRWRNLTGDSSMRILLTLFNQPKKSQKLCKKAVLFRLLPHQVSIQVCGLVYLIINLVLNFSKAVSSCCSQLGFSFAPPCRKQCEHLFHPYSLFFSCIGWSWMGKQWRGGGDDEKTNYTF